MTRDDAVSRELAAEVFERDRKIVVERAVVHGRLHDDPKRWLWDGQKLHFNTHGWRVICPAVVIDPAQWGKCWGRWRIEHVKKNSRIGKRAEPLPSRLMALCQGHTEDGMKAGHVWATAHRDEERDYLERANAPTS